MSKELIERLLDNRVTGFNLTVAAVEAADLIEAQAAQIETLNGALDDAATSLETIQLRSYGDESYLNHMDQVRGFAGSRAYVARNALSITPNEALQAFYERVKEQCAQVIEDWYSDSIDPREAADSIRNLKELPK